VLRGLLAEIGYADALIARQLPDGSYELIDGHLRAELTPEAEVPVLVVDLDEQEAAKLLAVLDPLAGLAEPDPELLAELVQSVETENRALRQFLDSLVPELPEPAPADKPPSETAVPEIYQVVVDCQSEAEQAALYERLTSEGYSCRLVTL
jgi:ParB-like chromosome segregation protein Spo0J